MKFASNKSAPKTVTPAVPEEAHAPAPEPAPALTQAEQLRAAHARAAATSPEVAAGRAHVLWREHVEPALTQLAGAGGSITAIRWTPGEHLCFPETLAALVLLAREKGFRAQLDSMGALLVDFGP